MKLTDKELRQLVENGEITQKEAEVLQHIINTKTNAEKLEKEGKHW